MTMLNSEVLGGTSFAGLGAASTKVIELLGACESTGAISAWSVLAYRQAMTEAKATTAAEVTRIIAMSSSAAASANSSASCVRWVYPSAAQTASANVYSGVAKSMTSAGSTRAQVLSSVEVNKIKTVEAMTSSKAQTSGRVVLNRYMSGLSSPALASTAAVVLRMAAFPDVQAVSALGSSQPVLRMAAIPEVAAPTIHYAAMVVEVSISATPDERVMSLSYENRVMEATSMSLLGKFSKQPAETLDYEINFADYLPSTDAIDSVASPPVVLVEPAGLTLVGTPIVLNNSVKLWFSGGNDGVTYKVTLTVTTEQGRVKQNEFKIKVKDV